VLVVEDEALVRSVTVRLLTKRGYRVLTAANGPEALDVAASHEGPIHLLLTDMVMPGMGGRELAQRFQGSRPESRVLFVSGYNEEDFANNGIDLSAGDLLEKPFTAEQLTLKVEQTLS